MKCPECGEESNIIESYFQIYYIDKKEEYMQRKFLSNDIVKKYRRFSLLKKGVTDDE